MNALAAPCFGRMVTVDRFRPRASSRPLGAVGRCRRGGWPHAGSRSARCCAFTLIELLVVVAVIALLISILLPALQGAREHGKATVCGAHLGQMALALHMYLEEERFYPGEHSMKGGIAFVTWAPRVRLYAGMQQKLFWCPSADNKSHWKVVMAPMVPLYVQGYGYQPGEKPLCMAPYGDLFCYGYNSWGVAEWVMNPDTGVCLGLGAHVDDLNWIGAWTVRPEHVRQPSEMICIADSTADGVWDSAIDPENWQEHEWPSCRHFGGAEVMFCDGHVVRMAQEKLVEPTEWARRRWNNDFLPHREAWQDDDPWGG